MESRNKNNNNQSNNSFDTTPSSVQRASAPSPSKKRKLYASTDARSYPHLEDSIGQAHAPTSSTTNPGDRFVAANIALETDAIAYPYLEESLSQAQSSASATTSTRDRFIASNIDPELARWKLRTDDLTHVDEASNISVAYGNALAAAVFEKNIPEIDETFIRAKKARATNPSITRSLQSFSPRLFSTSNYSKVTKKALYAPEDSSGFENDFYTKQLSWSNHQAIYIAMGRNSHIIDTSNMTTKAYQVFSHDITAVTASNFFTSCVFAVGDTQKNKTKFVVYDSSLDSLKRYFNIPAERILTVESTSPYVYIAGSDNYHHHRGSFFVLDERVGADIVSQRENAHNEKICGLAYNNRNILATGSNDDSVKIWDLRRTENPLQHYKRHTAAVKALSFSPHTLNHIASGSGLADHIVSVWNYETGEEESIFRASTTQGNYSQVTSVNWSTTPKELFVTSGSELQVWNYHPTFKTHIKTAFDHIPEKHTLCGALEPTNKKQYAALTTNAWLQVWDINAPKAAVAPTERSGLKSSSFRIR